MFIGELVKLTGVAAATIRYYEEVGLLKPIKRTRGGFRVYDERAVLVLRFIRHAQRLGFSLQDIRRVLKAWQRTGNPCPVVRNLVTQRLAQLDKWLKTLTALQERLEILARLLEAKESDDASAICPCVMVTQPLDNPLPLLPPEWRKRRRRQKRKYRKAGRRRGNWWWA
ncbi:MAG: hypothetical protein SLRJCFUN_002651 [Candidatus Fervidibacter sp.]|jgi:DNA-binding transcriptional MerR regulator